MIDIEQQICDIVVDRNLLSKYGFGRSNKPRMYEVCWYLSRTDVKKLWKEAVARCLGLVGRSDWQPKIVFGHVLYWGGERKEFYSVLEPHDLAPHGIEVNNVALITDDIYDMYLRLSKPTEILDWKLMPKRYLDDILGPSYTKTENSNACVQWEKNSLMRLLGWRHLGMVIAENSASQLTARFMLWGVKQRISVFVDWLRGIKSVYLSHPITEPRRQLRGTQWPSVVGEVNSIPGLLSQNGLSCVIPTALDERRFQETMMAGRRTRTGRLTRRWPVCGSMTDLLYVPQNDAGVEHAQLLVPKFWKASRKTLVRLSPPIPSVVGTKVSHLMDDLEEQIDFQISARDHQLVSHANAMLVFRPLFGGKMSFSRGVTSEVYHWSLIAEATRTNTAFVHFRGDVSQMISKRNGEGGLESPNSTLITEASKAIARRERMQLDVASNVVSNLCAGTSGRSVLSQGGIDPNQLERVRQDLNRIVPGLKADALWEYLTDGHSALKGRAGVFVFDGFSGFRNGLLDVTSFLKTGSPTSNQWEASVNTLLPFGPPSGF